MRVCSAAAILVVMCLASCDVIQRNTGDAIVPCQYNAPRGQFYKLRLETPGENQYRMAQPIPALLKPLPDGISIRAYPDEAAVTEAGCPGMPLRVFNHSGEPRFVPTIDFSLYMRQEALAPDGQWKPVEYGTTGHDEFSYFTISLAPESFWELEVPRYEGSYRTRLRFYLILGQGQYIYSPEFEGSVNPGQLQDAPYDPATEYITDLGFSFDTTERKFKTRSAFP